MYQAHFGLTGKPFGLTPDVGLRWPEPSQQIALNTLELALAEGEGFIVVIGEVGLGKTMLCRTLIHRLKAPFRSAWIPDPQLSPGRLRAAVAEELGLSISSRSSVQQLHRQLQQHLLELARAGQRPVLLIDEAQALSTTTLEAVRLLTNLETERRKLLQVVLFGQPELEQRLARPDLRQLRQRITFHCRLAPLDRAAVSAYVEHRCRSAGAAGTLFTRPAQFRLARASHGVPRRVNVLAHKALLAAWGKGRRLAGWAEVGRAIRDTDTLQATAGFGPRLARAAVLGGLLVAAWSWLGGLQP
ncbi:MAG: AAA family ATPase [Wenzhouxiangellaceae bacterium]|nr:AAA family ATPase [Wenzhouxiangellaceae bacterium]